MTTTLIMNMSYDYVVFFIASNGCIDWFGYFNITYRPFPLASENYVLTRDIKTNGQLGHVPRG